MNHLITFKKEVILCGKFFKIWYDSLKDILRENDLEEYLTTDVVYKKQKYEKKTAAYDLKEFKKKKNYKSPLY